MQISVQVLALMALSAGAAMAADCFGSNTQNVNDYWGMREQMCDNIQCAYQAECTVTLGSLKLTRENRGSSAGFPSCWVSLRIPNPSVDIFVVVASNVTDMKIGCY